MIGNIPSINFGIAKKTASDSLHELTVIELSDQGALVVDDRVTSVHHLQKHKTAE